MAPTVAMSVSSDEKRTKLGICKHKDAKTTENHTAGVDQAWKFLDRHRDAAAEHAPVDMDALRRRIDYRVVPLMFCCYTMQFLDKVILNVRTPSTGSPMSQRSPRKSLLLLTFYP